MTDSTMLECNRYIHEVGMLRLFDKSKITCSQDVQMKQQSVLNLLNQSSIKAPSIEINGFLKMISSSLEARNADNTGKLVLNSITHQHINIIRAGRIDADTVECSGLLDMTGGTELKCNRYIHEVGMLRLFGKSKLICMKRFQTKSVSVLCLIGDSHLASSEIMLYGLIKLVGSTMRGLETTDGYAECKCTISGDFRFVNTMRNAHIYTSIFLLKGWLDISETMIKAHNFTLDRAMIGLFDKSRLLVSQYFVAIKKSILRLLGESHLQAGIVSLSGFVKIRSSFVKGRKIHFYTSPCLNQSIINGQINCDSIDFMTQKVSMSKSSIVRYDEQSQSTLDIVVHSNANVVCEYTKWDFSSLRNYGKLKMSQNSKICSSDKVVCVFGGQLGFEKSSLKAKVCELYCDFSPTYSKLHVKLMRIVGSLGLSNKTSLQLEELVFDSEQPILKINNSSLAGINYHARHKVILSNGASIMMSGRIIFDSSVEVNGKVLINAKNHHYNGLVKIASDSLLTLSGNDLKSSSTSIIKGDGSLLVDVSKANLYGNVTLVGNIEVRAIFIVKYCNMNVHNCVFKVDGLTINSGRLNAHDAFFYTNIINFWSNTCVEHSLVYSGFISVNILSLIRATHYYSRSIIGIDCATVIMPSRFSLAHLLRPSFSCYILILLLKNLISGSLLAPFSHLKWTKGVYNAIPLVIKIISCIRLYIHSSDILYSIKTACQSCDISEENFRMYHLYQFISCIQSMVAGSLEMREHVSHLCHQLHASLLNSLGTHHDRLFDSVRDAYSDWCGHGVNSNLVRCSAATINLFGEQHDFNIYHHETGNIQLSSF